MAGIPRYDGPYNQNLGSLSLCGGFGPHILGCSRGTTEVRDLSSVELQPFKVVNYKNLPSSPDLWKGGICNHLGPNSMYIKQWPKALKRAQRAIILHTFWVQVLSQSCTRLPRTLDGASSLALASGSMYPNIGKYRTHSGFWDLIPSH